jgi:hypothetical protein
MALRENQDHTLTMCTTIEANATIPVFLNSVILQVSVIFCHYVVTRASQAPSYSPK